MSGHLRYARYVARHKWFVLIAGLRTGAPLWRLLIHDWTKLTRSEWNPYVRSFYGGWAWAERPAQVTAAFDMAWLHHQHANPHHWQHWVLREDSGATKVLEMPEHFVREMVADWLGAGRAINGYWDATNWYLSNLDKIMLAVRTRALVESLLGVHTDVRGRLPEVDPAVRSKEKQ